MYWVIKIQLLKENSRILFYSIKFAIIEQAEVIRLIMKIYLIKVTWELRGRIVYDILII